MNITIRKILTGLIFGALSNIFLLLFIDLSFIFDINYTSFPLSDWANKIIYIFILATIGGFLSTILLGYKNKLRSFLLGFLFGFIANAITPLIDTIVFLDEFSVLTTYYYFSQIVPFIAGIGLILFALPKEDYIPSVKTNLIIIAIIAINYLINIIYITANTETVFIEESATTTQVEN